MYEHMKQLNKTINNNADNSLYKIVTKTPMTNLSHLNILINTTTPTNFFRNISADLLNAFNSSSGNGSSKFPNNSNGARDVSNSPAKLTEIVILVILCILILLGNALVILAFLKGPRSIRTHTNYFVVNLAVCDFMVGCLSVPSWMLVRLNVAESLTRYFISMDVLFGTASILSLVAISLERMVAVSYPTQHFNMTNAPVYTALISTWVVGIILFAFKIWLNNAYMMQYTACIFVISFILPLMIIVASYIWLFRAASNLELADNQSHSQSLRRDLRIAKTISIIIGLFFVCWAPFFALNLLYYVICRHCLRNKTLVVLISIAKIMHYSNSMMNFFVYAVRSPEYRKTFDALLFRCDTAHLRERIRSMSATAVQYRKRTYSLNLRRNNNAESFIDMEEKLKQNGTTNHYGKTKLTVPNSGHNDGSYSDDTVTCETYSESPTMGFLDYSYD